MLKARILIALSRTPLVVGVLCLIFLLAPHGQALAQTCIPVHGLSFERIDRDKLLASREGRNIAIVRIGWGSLPARLGQFRFFSANLCLGGAESQFHIDGKLYWVDRIEIFRQ